MDGWSMILGMAAITFAIRYSLFAFPSLRFPPLAQQGLHYVPTAVLTAIVVPGMLMPDGEHWQLTGNAYLLGGLAAIAIAAFSRNLLATIGGGLLAFFLLRGWLGQLPL